MTGANHHGIEVERGEHQNHQEIPENGYVLFQTAF
jgi:hypothetical protein